MRFTDFSPPLSPTLDQQLDALKKGLGRAVQWAQSGRLDGEALLEVCLRDFRYDTQVVDSRGDWLWRLIQATGNAARFRVPILHALYQLSDERSAEQICELARYYAEEGDETFRTRLFEIVEQKPFAENRGLGEDAIIELEGEPAFLFAARARGKQLAGRNWDWDDDMFLRAAIETWGDQRVTELLEQSNDRAIDCFREAWLEQKKKDPERDRGSSREEKMRAMTAAEIIAFAQSSNARYFRLASLGKHADATVLGVVIEQLWATEEPTVIANLLTIFSTRPFPKFDDRLLELCRHADDEVRRRASYALANLGHPKVREFALAELQRGLPDQSFVKLLKANYQRGDEKLLLDAIDLPVDAWELHGLLSDVIEVLTQNGESDSSQLGIACYASTPCENCRYKAASLLAEKQVAPSWLIEECRFDAYERIAVNLKFPQTCDHEKPSDDAHQDPGA